MKIYNKIARTGFLASLAVMLLGSCAEGTLYNIDAPDWLADRIQEIADANKQPDEEQLEGMQEDVYSFGNTDYSSGWWTAFSKYYVVPDGQKWNAVFTLHTNPADNKYYKNFVLILCNDVPRGGAGYKEYGAIRFDFASEYINNDPSRTTNSQWGDYIDKKYISGTLMLNPDDKEEDPNLQKLAGKVTLTVDRTSPDAFTVKMTNGTATKLYKQPYKEENLNASPSNTNMRCFIVAEGSYIDFLQTNIVPEGGLTSAQDKSPVSMVLNNIPAQITLGTSLDKALAAATATVTFEEGVTKNVPAADLHFSAVPDLTTPGQKTLVAVYNKTFKGENASTPVVASATFELVEKVASIAVTTPPARTSYYFYTSDATRSLTSRTMAFDPTGMVVTATYNDGSKRPLDHSRLKFSAVSAKAGQQTVTITGPDGTVAKTTVNVAASAVNDVTFSSQVGASDNTTGFAGAFSADVKVEVGATACVKFTNYSDLAANWNNFLVFLRKADKSEYAFVRADNWGTGIGYDACSHAGTQGDWAAWLAGMNGAKVTLYVTNCGNGTCDVQAIMTGSNGKVSTQYYLGINKVDTDDLFFALSVEKSHLVFSE